MQDLPSGSTPQKTQAQGAVSVRYTRISENSQFWDVVTFIATLVISATKFTLVGSFSDLSSWRISPVVEALIPTARRRQHLHPIITQQIADIPGFSQNKIHFFVSKKNFFRNINMVPKFLNHYATPQTEIFENCWDFRSVQKFWNLRFLQSAR